MFTLTKTQRAYLRQIVESGRLNKGWGGYGSSRVVWRLEELGLINLVRYPRLDQADHWTAQATTKGRDYEAQLASR